MIDEFLLKALLESNVEALLDHLNKGPCSQETVSALEKELPITTYGSYGESISTLERKKLLSFYMCYVTALAEVNFEKYKQVIQNLESVQNLSRFLQFLAADEILKSAIEDKDWEEILTLLTIIKLDAIRPETAGLLIDELCKIVKNASSATNGAIVAIFQNLFRKENFFEAFQRSRIHALKKLMEILSNTNYFPSHLLREIFFHSEAKLYGIPLVALHLRDIPKFMQAPKDFLKSQGATLKQQIAANLLKAKSDYWYFFHHHSSLDPTEIIGISILALYDRFIEQFKKVLDRCASIKEAEFFYTAVTTFNSELAEKVLVEDFDAFTDEQTKCYQDFMENLLDSEANLYAKAILHYDAIKNSETRYQLKEAFQERVKQIKQPRIS